MLYLNLQKYQRDKLFQYVTNTREMMSVCLSALEYIQYWTGNSEVKRRPYLCLDFDNTHRIYLVDTDKIISFGFDLIIKLDNPVLDNPDNHIKGIYLNQHMISAREISEAKQVLSNNIDPDLLYCLNVLEEDASVLDSSLRLFEHFAFFEWGYLRYDYDPVHSRIGFHPTNHLDINFSRFLSYKIGLKRKISLDGFMSLMCKNSKCAELDM